MTEVVQIYVVMLGSERPLKANEALFGHVVLRLKLDDCCSESLSPWPGRVGYLSVDDTLKRFIPEKPETSNAMSGKK